MKILNKSQMPDGTNIQIEDWKDVYSFMDIYVIGTYPKSKAESDKYFGIHRGETFRLELNNFSNNDEVISIFNKLEKGEIKLEQLQEHFRECYKDSYCLGFAKENLPKNEYVVLKDKQQQEFDNFPLYWAFGEKQYKDLLEKLNLTEEQARTEIVSGPVGCLMLKSDVPKFEEMLEKHTNELQEAITNDKNGIGFIKDMFCSELYNHEYLYTRDLTQTLMSLGLDEKDFNKNPALAKGLKIALNTIDRDEEISDYAEDMLLSHIQDKFDNNSITEGEFNFLHKRDVCRDLAEKIIYEIQSINPNEPLALEKEFNIIDKNINETLEEAHKEFLIKEPENEAKDEDEPEM